MTLKLTSPAFQSGSQVPSRFTCDGDNISPPLAWSGVPPEARSLAMICRDPDAPSGDWYHWAVYDIPAGLTEIMERQAAGGAAMRQAINDFGKRGYGGPCPPHGHGRHHYHFTVYALDCEHLAVAENARCRQVEKAAKAHAIATAELIGMYER